MPEVPVPSPAPRSRRRPFVIILIIVIILGGAASVRKIVRRSRAASEPATAPGRFLPARGATTPAAAANEDDRLRSLPYLPGTRPAQEAFGVVKFDRARAWAGTNLCVSAHAPEASLLDMEGRELYSWRLGRRAVWPELKHESEQPYQEYWRRFVILPGGDALALYHMVGIVRIDKDSRLVWASKCGAHHTLTLLPDGSFYTLTYRKRIDPAVSDSIPVVEDWVTRLGPEGKELESFSLMPILHEAGIEGITKPFERGQKWDFI